MSGLRRWRRLVRLLVVAACLVALVWTVVRLGPGQVARAALDADPLWLLLSLPAIASRFLIWGFKWQRLLGRDPVVPYRVGLRILLAGSFVNLTTPTAKLAGGFLRAGFLHRRYGWGLAPAYGRSFVDQGTNALGTLLLFGLATPLTGDPRWMIAGGLVLLALIVGLSLRGWLWRHLDRIPTRFGSKEWLRPTLEPFLCGRLLQPLILAALSFSGFCLANALVLRALGVTAELGSLVVVVVVGYFAGILVGAGGIGVTEAALTALYIRSGIAPDVATAGALLHRAGYYLVVLIWGGPSLIAESRWRNEPDHSPNSTSTPV